MVDNLLTVFALILFLHFFLNFKKTEFAAATLICCPIMLLSFLSFYQNWILPSIIDLFLLSLIGILGGLANLWLSQSYKLSEVSLVTPLKYLALVFAIIFGYFIWNEIPTFKTLIGAGLVILSSFIIFRREIVLKKRLSTSRHE